MYTSILLQICISTEPQSCSTAVFLLDEVRYSSLADRLIDARRELLFTDLKTVEGFHTGTESVHSCKGLVFLRLI